MEKQFKLSINLNNIVVTHSDTIDTRTSKDTKRLEKLTSVDEIKIEEPEIEKPTNKIQKVTFTN